MNMYVCIYKYVCDYMSVYNYLLSTDILDRYMIEKNVGL